MPHTKENRILKTFYVVFFYLIYGFSDFALLLIGITQTGLNIFTGEPNQSLQKFGVSLGSYVKQITEYVSYTHEDKPFPFSDWPNS